MTQRQVATEFIRREMIHQGQLFPRVHAAYLEYVSATPDAALLWEAQRDLLSRQLARLATQVPFYYRDVGHRVASGDPFAQLATLPLVDRATVRSRLADLCSDDIDTAACRFGSTSGTSGVPVRVVLDDAHLVHLYALAQVRADRYGLGFHRKVLSPFQNWVTGWFEYTAPAQGLSRIAEFGVRDGGPSAAELVIKAAAFEPDVVFGHPSDCVQLAHAITAAGVEIRPRAVITYGERLLSANRATMASAFGAPVYDTYGMREVGAIAAECERGSYHLESERLWVEVVDPSGRPAPDGVEGELVVTNLITEAMPLTRYRTGDIGALGTTPCECGRPQRRLRLVEGRALPGLTLPSGRLVPASRLAAVLRRHPVERFQFVHESPDHLVVLVRPAPGAVLPLDAVRTQLLTGVDHAMTVDVRVVDDGGFVPAGSRKHVDVVSRFGPAPDPEPTSQG